MSPLRRLDSRPREAATARRAALWWLNYRGQEGYSRAASPLARSPARTDLHRHRLSGTTRRHRAGLDNALAAVTLAAGSHRRQVVLTTTKFDRFARNVAEAGEILTEFQANLNHLRTREGMAKARAKGRLEGNSRNCLWHLAKRSIGAITTPTTTRASRTWPMNTASAAPPSTASSPAPHHARNPPEPNTSP